MYEKAIMVCLSDISSNFVERNVNCTSENHFVIIDTPEQSGKDAPAVSRSWGDGWTRAHQMG